MIGIDTSFLVAFEVAGHELNHAAWNLARRYASERFALVPQVLSEFIHVTTDSQRFETPLSVAEATERALRWWNASETVQVFPSTTSVELFARWMKEYSLGRERILDTMLAAAYKSGGAQLVLTADTRDFARYPGMHPVLLR